jgi:hypothetical protein
MTMSDIKPRFTTIEKEISAQVGTVVLENPVGYPRGESNLYCIGPDGQVIWFAQLPEAGTLYTRVKFDDQGEKLLTYSTRSHACEIDLQTGKLLSQISIK